jgi:hypothetical protein
MMKRPHRDHPDCQVDTDLNESVREKIEACNAVNPSLTVAQNRAIAQLFCNRINCAAIVAI